MESRLARLLHGLDSDHLTRFHERGLKVHTEIVAPLEALIAEAANDDISIRLCSGHRSFEQQRWIWNGKAQGRRALVDSEGRQVKSRDLEPDPLIDTILRWSALPGCSRHHWGTDIDVYDAAAVPSGYELQLTAAEAATKFARMHAWLDEHMHRFGFFRPYADDLGGIAPEAWHLSYAPIAGPYFVATSLGGVEEVLKDSRLALKERVLERLPELFERYARRITTPSESARGRTPSPATK